MHSPHKQLDVASAGRGTASAADVVGVAGVHYDRTVIPLRRGHLWNGAVLHTGLLLCVVQQHDAALRVVEPVSDDARGASDGLFRDDYSCPVFPYFVPRIPDGT